MKLNTSTVKPFTQQQYTGQLHSRPRAAHKTVCAITDVHQQDQSPALKSISRRTHVLALVGGCSLVNLLSAPLPATAASIEIIEDKQGDGTHAVAKGDLVLIHYVGTLVASGEMFDSTKGGAVYRDGGQGIFRPIIVRQGGDPVPGICAGLQAALEGMKVGGTRTVEFPAELGFGSRTVLAPYAIVPADSKLRYTVELLRVSTVGPDALMKGISQCGGGAVMERSEGCRNIQIAEFL